MTISTVEKYYQYAEEIEKAIAIAGSSGAAGKELATNEIIGENTKKRRRSIRRAGASERAAYARRGVTGGLGNNPLMEAGRYMQEFNSRPTVGMEHGGRQAAEVAGSRTGAAALGRAPSKDVARRGASGVSDTRPVNQSGNAPRAIGAVPSGSKDVSLRSPADVGNRAAAPSGGESRTAGSSTQGARELATRSSGSVERGATGAAEGGEDVAQAARKAKKSRLAGLGQAWRDNTFGFRDQSHLRAVADQPTVHPPGRNVGGTPTPKAVGKAPTALPAGPTPRGTPNAVPPSTSAFAMPAGDTASAAKTGIKGATAAKAGGAAAIGLGALAGAAALGRASSKAKPGGVIQHVKNNPWAYGGGALATGTAGGGALAYNKRR